MAISMRFKVGDRVYFHLYSIPKEKLIGRIIKVSDAGYRIEPEDIDKLTDPHWHRTVEERGYIYLDKRYISPYRPCRLNRGVINEKQND